jgi:hypothetical protein
MAKPPLKWSDTPVVVNVFHNHWLQQKSNAVSFHIRHLWFQVRLLWFHNVHGEDGMLQRIPLHEGHAMHAIKETLHVTHHTMMNRVTKYLMHVMKEMLHMTHHTMINMVTHSLHIVTGLTLVHHFVGMLCKLKWDLQNISAPSPTRTQFFYSLNRYLRIQTDWRKLIECSKSEHRGIGNHPDALQY